MATFQRRVHVRFLFCVGGDKADDFFSFSIFDVGLTILAIVLGAFTIGASGSSTFGGATTGLAIGHTIASALIALLKGMGCARDNPLIDRTADASTLRDGPAKYVLQDRAGHDAGPPSAEGLAGIMPVLSSIPFQRGGPNPLSPHQAAPGFEGELGNDSI